MRYLLIFTAEAVLFFLATLNIRACAKGHVTMTLGTDAGIAGLNFFLISKIAEQDDYGSMTAYVAGALVGSYIGMFVSRQWRGE